MLKGTSEMFSVTQLPFRVVEKYTFNEHFFHRGQEIDLLFSEHNQKLSKAEKNDLFSF